MFKFIIYLFFSIAFFFATKTMIERGVIFHANSTGGIGKNALYKNFVLALNFLLGEQLTILVFAAITATLVFKVVQMIYRGYLYYIK